MVPSLALADAMSAPIESLDGDPVTIGGDTFWIGELTIDQTVAAARILSIELSKTSVEAGLEIRDGLERSVAGASDPEGKAQAGIGFVTTFLNPDTITALVSALLDRDLQWCRKNVKLSALIAIAVAVYQHNDWKSLLALFPKAAPDSTSGTSPTSSDGPLAI